METAKVICLTPTKNEAWIIGQFIEAAQTWADHIIIADQGSTDSTVEIAKSYQRVTVVSNEGKAYDEFSRQKILIEEARKIPGKRLLITLDADEFFSPEVYSAAEWKQAKKSPAGTVLRFRWLHILPGFKQGLLHSFEFPWGFMDDGFEHSGRSIHSPRVPVPDNALNICLNRVKVIHHGFYHTTRTRSKLRWYSAWELKNGLRKQGEINRQYEYSRQAKGETIDIPESWFHTFDELGLDLTSTRKKIRIQSIQSGDSIHWVMDEDFWWDQDVFEWLLEDSKGVFATLDVWDKDWSAYAERINQTFKYKRSFIDRAICRISRSSFANRSSLYRSLENIYL